VSDCFQARRSGIIYKRYGIAPEVIHIPTTIHTTTIIITITTDTVMIIHIALATPPKVDWLHWPSVWSPALARYW